MKKNQIKQLAAYSAMALPVLLSAGKAKAQIIYHDVDPDFHFSDIPEISGTFNLHLDINDDGINDLDFYASDLNFYVLPRNGAQLVADCCLLSPKVFNQAQGIGAAEAWSAAGISYFFEIDYNSGSVSFTTGRWKNEVNKFIGVRIPISGTYHYGWVRLNSVVSVDAPPFITDINVIDDAWNVIPDAPIHAGDGIPANCIIPQLLTAQAGITAAELQWDITPGALQYQVFYRKSGTTAWNKIKSQYNHKIIAGLDCNCTYEWKIRSDCADGTSTDFSAIENFSTAVCKLRDLSDQPKLNVYPNPATDHLFIDMGGMNTSDLQIEIFDLFGNAIQQLNYSNDDLLQIDISGLANGMYVLHITNADVNKTVQFIKQ